MFDPVRGLRTLKKDIPTEGLEEYYTLEARLMENLQKTDLYGDTPTSSAEKSAVMKSLNKLAIRYSRQSFNDMCADPPVIPLPLSSSEHPKSPVRDQSLIPANTFIELLAPIVPTAYCKNLDVAIFPLLQVTVDTTDSRCSESALHLHTWIEGYTDEEIKPISLPAGDKKVVPLFPLFKHDVIKNLKDSRDVTLHIHIKHSKPIVYELHETRRIRLLAYNTALLALELKDKTVVDLSSYLSAWVTPRDQHIEKFVSTVLSYHGEHTLEGYPDPGSTDPDAVVRKQVQAVYDALKYEVKLAYADTSLASGNPNEQIVQYVKLPAETLAGGYANCLDATVLFASVLEAMSLRPLIMLEKGHAYLGWNVSARKEDDRKEYLETTLIDTADFKEAFRQGMERYNFAVANQWLDHKINNISGYLRIIDVFYWHNHNILSL